jgi:O-methyltransferase involved in polyketide biosynthesis
VPLPDHLIFVPINFNTQSLEGRLDEAGFKKGARTLFLLEGLTMYLTADAVDSIFDFMTKNSGACRFDDGKKTGEWNIYNKDGTLISKKKYRGNKKNYTILSPALGPGAHW